MTKSFLPVLGTAFSVVLSGTPFAGQQAGLVQPGPLSVSTDVGTDQRGTTEYRPADSSYRISGGGADVWGTQDGFRYAWKPLQGDATLEADLQIEAPVTSPLAKGMLMFRESLDPGSPYADLALHADGHITLQYRLEPRGETRDITLSQFNVRRLRLVRQGDRFTAFADAFDNGRRGASVSVVVPMSKTVYVGLGVCSHNTDVLQNISFHHFSLRSLS